MGPGEKDYLECLSFFLSFFNVKFPNQYENQNPNNNALTPPGVSSGLRSPHEKLPNSTWLG